jgi:hypothetical protein
MCVSLPHFSGLGRAFFSLQNLAHPHFFILVGVQAGGIRIIRLGGIPSSEHLSAYPPQREVSEGLTLNGRQGSLPAEEILFAKTGDMQASKIP